MFVRTPARRRASPSSSVCARGLERIRMREQGASWAVAIADCGCTEKGSAHRPATPTQLNTHCDEPIHGTPGPPHHHCDTLVDKLDERHAECDKNHV